MSWHLGRLAAFDLETTAPDPEEARIVTACVAFVGGGQEPHTTTWLSDVDGAEIPAEAAAIHGVTTEHARAKGRPAKEVVQEIVSVLEGATGYGVPVVAMNARYDLTALDRDARRLGVTPLDIESGLVRVVDPFVIDKAVDRWRKGSRTLTALCEHYQVKLEGAHDAAADAVAAARVAWRLGSVHPRLAAMSLDELHRAQVAWARQQAEGLREYFERTPDKRHLAATVRGEWPLIPAGVS